MNNFSVVILKKSWKSFLLTYANIVHFVKSTYSKLKKIVETKELNVLNRFIMVLIQKQMNLKGKWIEF